MQEAIETAQPESRGIWKVILASSGTMIEWYDFYIFAILLTTLATVFFPKGAAGLLQTLGVIAAGFIIRPFGAAFFGRIGDVVGRKYTFLLTLLLMGGSTFAIGLLPTYSQVGIIAPALLLALRLIQGLALGGEYGGAATYVAEYSPEGRRGFFTSFIQTTATLGLLASLAVLLVVRKYTTPTQFSDWGWRVPFMLSAILVFLSYGIRRKMAESPLFARLKARGKVSSNPLKESFARPANRKLVLLALFGATAGQGVVWYTAQFYALYYLQTVLHVAMTSAYLIMAIALLLGTPLFVYFGARSDRRGRKSLIVGGCALAAVLYIPIYAGMGRATNVDTFQDLGGALSVRHESKTGPESTVASTIITRTYEEGTVTQTHTQTTSTTPNAAPKFEDTYEIVPSGQTGFILVVLVLIQVVFVTMVYGPIAAFLVELFPTQIRYTSMSVPYHIGNGVFGGLVPIIGKTLEGSLDHRYGGLAYPIAIALVTALVGGIFIKERRNARLSDEDEMPTYAVVETEAPTLPVTAAGAGEEGVNRAAGAGRG